MFNYIFPILNIFNSFEELKKDVSMYGYFSFLYFDTTEKIVRESLNNLDKTIILSEPGYGKTRLLKEIVQILKEHNKNVMLIDLKQIDLNQDLDSYIKDFAVNVKDIDEIETEEDLDRFDLIGTKDFELINDNSVAICLDALDEVKRDDRAITIRKLLKFLETFNNVSIFISCRISHFDEYNNSFLKKGFKFVKINSFSRNQVREYLLNQKFKEGEINYIFDFFKIKDRELIIQVPRYLKILSLLAEKVGVNNLIKLKKYELFELFIDRKLGLESNIADTKNLEIKKRILEKLALVMEIYQANKISKNDLITFFDDIVSNISISFLSQLKIEDLYTRSLIKEDKNSIEFENTEFQEFLAAKEIIRLGRSNQILFDLAIDPELREIYPSWINTLNFLVDLEPSLLKQILDFVRSQETHNRLEELHKLLSKVDFTRVDLEEKSEIFKQVFSYYQKNLIWIELEVSRGLRNFFDSELTEIIKKSIDGRSFKGKSLNIRVGNVANVISQLVKNNKIDEAEKKYWQRRFINLIRVNKDDTVLQRNILSAFSSFKDIALIKTIYPFLNKDDELVQQDLLLACRRINSNYKFSINCFIEGIKKKNTFARYGFYDINRYESINNLLDTLIEDSDFLYAFLDMESMFNKDEESKIIENIRSFQDTKINKKLEKILIKSFEEENWINAERSNFIKGIMSLLKKAKDDYLFDLIQLIRSNEKLSRHLSSFTEFFSFLLEKKYVNRFINELATINSGKGKLIAFHTILDIKFSKRQDAEEIYEESRKNLLNYYQGYDENISKVSDKPSKELEVYKKFKFKLEPKKDKYSPGVFRFYLNNENELERFIKEEDRKRLVDLVVNYVFKNFDPKNQKLYVKDKSDGTIYSTNEFITIFGDCLKVAKELKIDISGFETKIIHYIPYAFYEHLECIFELYPNPSENDLNELLKVYTKERKDDLQIFRPDSFIRASEKYKIEKAIPVLSKFVDNDLFSLQERIDALRVIAKLKASKGYFDNIFQQYNKKSGLTKLADLANEVLINLFSDNKAIEWRFKQLVIRTFPVIEKKGVHIKGGEEIEIHEKKFAAPLMQLNEPKYRKHYLRMLDESFDILSRGNEYYEYTYYLWDIIISYYNNIKEYRSYDYLCELENEVITKHGVKEGVNWFNYKLRDLKRIYINYISKPVKMAECIKKYNKFKQIQYLNISTSIDLINTIRKTIDIDIVNWIQKEGAYRFIQTVKRKEYLIQTTIKTQLQFFLQKYGFRENDFILIREPQLLDEKRPDFLIYYGFIGPVLIEIKLVDNDEILNERKRILYKKKLIKYIKGFYTIHCFFIIFQINEDNTIDKYIQKLKEIYKDCQDIDIIGIKCLSE